MQNVASVYIHIPFCKSICSYCNFCKFLYEEKWVRLYLLKLHDEIKDRYMGEVIKTIYIGGGTPSCLSMNELKYLLSLTNYFKKSDSLEFTFECNIEDINEELLSLLKSFNVNRLSIGIESFDKDNLLFLKRNNNIKDTVNKIKLIRQMGFNNINLDLIYAIPDESFDALKLDLKYLVKLKPEHISTYSLSIEDNTYLSYKRVNPIDEDIDYEMYEYICSYLKRHGYNHYEISNFAKEGYESNHNLVYWNNLEYYGFGCGASGYVDGIRYDNKKNLTAYLNGDINSNNSILNLKDKMDYEVILGLRKINGIDLFKFYKKYNIQFERAYNIKELLDNKDLIIKNNHIMINPKKIYIMNEILIKLV